MRFANLAGRLALVVGDGMVDVERASGGRFPADPQAAYERWDALVAWAAGVGGDDARQWREEDLGPPAPRPGQVFAIGLNYRDHAAEAGFQVPKQPTVFTKFRSAVTGPYGGVALPPGDVDWEV
ncbi:MAG TPA: fumarylacetoacetate hydrolase family protein, partial [Acidimicrobiales bacterium]